MPSKWDAIIGDAPAGDIPAQPPSTATTQTLDTPQGASQWDDVIARGKTNDLMNHDTGFLTDLWHFFKFAGHGLTSGDAELFGFPVDSYNAAASFLENHPTIAKIAQVLPPTGMLATLMRSTGYKKIPSGGSEQFKQGANKLGLPTSEPDESAGAAGEWGYTMGEFTGANLPAILFAPEKAVIGGVTRSVPNIARIVASNKPFTALLHDLASGAWGPGIGAITGEEFAGPEHKEAGKTIGGIAGGLRLLPFEVAGALMRSGSSWMREFLGPKGRVGTALATATQDLPKAKEMMTAPAALSPGATVPVDIKSEDEGLLALRRAVMSNDAELHGDYRRMQKATAAAIAQDAKFSRANYPDVQSWLDAKQRGLEELINKRQMQAVEQAERDTSQAFAGTSPNAIDANQVKNAYATTLKSQLLLALDDAKAAVDDKWSKVDKNLQVPMEGVYDKINTLKAEHAARPGQSEARFPTELFQRFYKTDAEGHKTPKFGPGTRLQDVIDLTSEVEQAIREESAKDAPNRVYMSYLTRLASSLQTAKESLPEDSLPALKDANNATRALHQTFSQGPVGQVLGHDVPGAPNIFPGDTIRHFLSQGPAGIDNFDTLMRALSQRSGKTTPIAPTSTPQTLLRQYIRQDFYDHAMANGQFNKRAAEQWMRNNSGPLLHFSDMRKEFDNAIKSQGDIAPAGIVSRTTKQSLEDLRSNRAALFLGGKPGELFNGAVNANDKYGATKELLKMTADDPTGRATEGLGQMAFDNMMASALSADHSSMDLQRINGIKIAKWYDKNKGVVKALDEKLPGIAKRFERIVSTSRYLEGFNVSPTVPQKEHANAITGLITLLAKIQGANIFSKFGYRGGSIQTAAIGSKAFQKLAEKLTPDQSMKLFRRAMIDPEFFDLLVTPITDKNYKMHLRLIQPYMYSMGIPMAQPLLHEDQDQNKRAVNQ